MAGERRNGNLLVHVGPKLQAYPEELLRQRRGHDGHTEYLIRWTILSLDDSIGSNTNAVPENKTENILMWMSAEEVYANCPTLLGKRKPEGQRVKEEKAPSTYPSDVTLDEASLLEMKTDVRNLVQRAARQMARTTGPESSILNTIHVLSAYASIGSLTGVFKETGALDLLMKMLCNEEKQIRRSAGKMLRALASHDAGSRAYVLLSLSQQDGIEQHMDFDSRYTLLELFAETTSSEEHCMSFEGIHLPQIPGKLLFSLVKRYLCVTSLMDKLNSTTELGGERQDCATSSANFGEKSRVQREFDFSMAMANLISELVRVMGWDHSQERELLSLREIQPRVVRSIFQPKGPTCTAVQVPLVTPKPSPRKKTGNVFLTLSDFSNRSNYVEYVQENLKPGMTVRMLEDYEEISAGDKGEFRQSNSGMPPVQVLWQSTGHTYWVHWHMIEITGFGEQPEEEAAQDKVSSLAENLKLPAVTRTFYCKPLGGLYSLPYLTDEMSEHTGTLSRAEWWELLFFIKKLEQHEQQEVVHFIQQNHKEQLLELDEEGLIQLSVSVELAQKVLQLLSKLCQGCTRNDLQSSHIYLKYSFSKGRAEQNCQNGDVTLPECGSLSEAMASKKPKKEQFSAELPSTAPSTTEKTDTQLINELLKVEGLAFPDTLDEKVKVFCSMKLTGKRSSLEKIADIGDIIQKSSSEVALQMAGLRLITKLLEEEPGQARQVIKADGGLTVREKMVKMLVELLSNQLKEKLLVVMALRLLYVLVAKYDWRVLFATEGGVRAVLGCMQEYPTSALVQQAGLAALKVLVGAGNCELLGTSGKSYPLNHSDAQMMREIFASIGSASSKDSDNLLCAIPAAVQKMLDTSGASSAVQNGLLVLNMLINNHKGLAEQLGNSDLHSVLQNCCRSGQSSNEMLARIVLNRLAEHKLPLSQENTDPEATFELKDMDVPALLSSLRDTSFSKEVVLALERCLCDEGVGTEGDGSEFLPDREHFLLLLKTLEQLGAEKSVQLGVLRILNKFLDCSKEDVLPWHECIKPCLSSMSVHSNEREVVQEFIRFLHRLATTNKDCAVVMCRVGTKDALTKAMDKHNSNLLLVTELRDLVTDCEKYASLYKKMTTSILAGCIQMVLGQIEEHRRSHQPINIPFFDVFLRNLCQGSNVEVKEDKCWERIEVSSNPHRASKLTDRNLKTYWESNGSTGSHYINVYMHRGVVVRQMTLLVASEDSSYMPARIVVMGGENASSITTELNTVNVLPSASRVVLLENMIRFWPIIQIKIKRCQQGGIDTRVRGIEVLGPKPTFWPIFKEQLCRRTFLFYTTKAHTWCQEIAEDRRQLLQLFNRLNSALHHEQDFADRFLPDDEAAQALGKTCWDALITPLVQSITSPDPSGISPLSWLLSQYLENLKAAARAKKQAAIFNSRVRRLSHLLVHVDSSSPETEELKAPVKSNGKNGKSKESSSGAAKPVEKKPSSTTGITQCWKGVVQQQVKRFLESSWQDPDFVEQYCNIYLRLRTAMEELFGQQMCFMLALRQGFSGGLLQLSFLTAMHVSEQFARYIDVWIQKSWADSGNVETLQRLQRSLEPVLFLSGLELTNTFEHFYRYYLGDRLLSQGKTWLESAVVEHIGLCFPNRFPQQMLKNLSELEEEQQQFHLFQLQQLDKHLLELDQDGKYEEEEEGGEVMEEEPNSQEEEPEVKVLALSPRCWTISPLCYLEEPARFFPPSLSQHLGRFADFYTQSQSRFGLEHTKPRRLQWTWLGHAELQYQGCILHVSTLQMYILLCFNSAEEVSVETLLEATNLSPVLLGHALKPLTKENGILSQNQSVLKLNEGTLAQASGQRLWLLPKQTYLNVEENEGSALEKKRNIICCLLIQILKEEKEIHIDNLVFRVMDACQKWESSSALKFLSFCCSSTDVLSCILHLLNQGYIRRQEDSPQLLEYVSAEPSTPHRGQAQLIFQNADCQNRKNSFGTDVNNKISPFRLDTFRLGTEEVLMETVLLPRGRTMSQEEVEVLMTQTIQRVSDTLSVSADIAQHLLIHCKWNVDVLIQRYTEDAEQLLFSSGLQVRNPQPPLDPVTHCPVCVNQLTPEDNSPVLCCLHYCCKACWNEYLATRIEQNLILNCTCPIADCPAQPTTDFIRSIISSKEVIAKYEKALLRGYVECCSNLTWCTNPQGCDQILCKEGLGCGEACSKCSWISCFNCNFPEAHYPASCSHMSQWMDDGGYYEGMTVEAQSKHLAKLISKRCPSCQSQIEKNEGCLHMTCAKCNHGFCWRCLKPWKPTHKDYYNCSAMVSKAARQEKRFQDYNERCTFHHQAREFAMNLRNRVSTISDVPQIRTLTFVVDACKMLEQARKVLAYSCVYSYYNQDTEKMDIMEQQSENLELHTNALQILLEETLLQCQDVASSIRLLKAEDFNTGLELVRRIQERLLAILQHATQDFRMGFQTRQSSEQREMKLSNVPNATPAYKALTFDEGSDSPDTDDGGKEEEDEDEDDEEYVPEWQEEYDDEDLDDDNISYDDESENLERDSFFFEDEDEVYD
ncbi:cullin-9-like [Heteronotia binoei]|uniref:cullin-9-like n=1 Tax=Heteronotia binoei TaxID=13085 RepID=UPI00292E45AC|nr:cullin-9-like [Heteronotia binoei]